MQLVPLQHAEQHKLSDGRSKEYAFETPCFQGDVCLIIDAEKPPPPVPAGAAAGHPPVLPQTMCMAAKINSSACLLKRNEFTNRAADDTESQLSNGGAVQV
jgi:hypothetical protein